MESGDPEEASERLERMRAAVRASPRSTTFVALAHALCDAGLSAEAEAVSRQGLMYHPDLPTGQVALARAWMEAGRNAQAESALRETIHHHPTHADAYRWLAELLSRTGRGGQAITLLTQTRASVVWSYELAACLQRLIEESNPVASPLVSDPGATGVFDRRRLQRRRGERRIADRRNIDESSTPPPVPSTPRRTPPVPVAIVEVAYPAPSSGDDHTDSEITKPDLTPPPVTPQVAASTPAPSLPVLLASADMVPVTPSPAGGAPTPIPSRLAATPPALEWVPPPAPERAVVAPVRQPAAPVQRTFTPTGSFPPIETEGPNITLPPRGWRLSWWWAAALVPAAMLVALAAGQPQRRDSPPEPESAATVAVKTKLEADLTAGTLDTLVRARDAARKQLGLVPRDESVRATLAFVVALLAYQYGVDADKPEIRELTADLPKSEPATGVVRARRDAARAILNLASGERLIAEEGVRGALALAPKDARVQLAAALVRYRAGDLDAAQAALDRPGLTAELGAARWALAAVQIDRGAPAAALATLEPAPGRPRDDARDDALVLLLATEARRAAGTMGPVKDGATEAQTRACARQSRASRAVAAACLLDEGVALRLDGDRDGALERARRAAAIGTAEPRTLGVLAQLLANLGEIDDAGVQAARAARYTAPQLPAVAWANLAVSLGRGDSARLNPELRVVGPEARVIAARAAADRGQAQPAAADDPDLHWLTTLGQAPARKQSVRLIERMEDGPHPGPVAAYVAGSLAAKAGRRHLAARWLAKSLTGHGDTCRAARHYAAVMQSLKRKDASEKALGPLAGHNSSCQIP